MVHFRSVVKSGLRRFFMLSLLIVGAVDCVMDANLVTSICQPIHGPHSLIGRSSTGFDFIPSILDEAGRNILSKIPSYDGRAAVCERLLFWVSSIFFCFVFIIRGFHWVDFSWQVFFCLYWWARINLNTWNRSDSLDGVKVNFFTLMRTWNIISLFNT